MTRPPPIDAWVIEAEADLIQARGDDTDRLVTAWIRRHGLPDRVWYTSEHVGGPRLPRQRDVITLPGRATFEQVQELARDLGRAYDLPVRGRRGSQPAVTLFAPSKDDVDPTPAGEPT